MADDDGPSLTWFYPAGGDGGDGGGGGGGGGGTSSADGSAAVYSCQIRAKKLHALPNPDEASDDGQDDPGGSALCGILTEKQPGVNSKTTVVVSSLVMMTGTQPVPLWHHIDYEDFYDAWVQNAQIALAIEGHTPIDPPFHKAQAKAHTLKARSGASSGGSSSSSTSTSKEGASPADVGPQCRPSITQSRSADNMYNVNMASYKAKLCAYAVLRTLPPASRACSCLLPTAYCLVGSRQ